MRASSWKWTRIERSELVIVLNDFTELGKGLTSIRSRSSRNWARFTLSRKQTNRHTPRAGLTICLAVTDRQTDTHTHTYTDIPFTHTHTRATDRQTDRQTDTPTPPPHHTHDRQTDRQIDLPLVPCCAPVSQKRHATHKLRHRAPNLQIYREQWWIQLWSNTVLQTCKYTKSTDEYYDLMVLNVFTDRFLEQPQDKIKGPTGRLPTDVWDT